MRCDCGRPNTVAPGLKGCAIACARALATGRRATEAAATAALSMMRLPIISITAGSTATGSDATSAIFQAS
jgi:hypothetical protein